MKKMIRFFTMLLAILFLPLAAQAQPGSQPHPDPYSGDLSNYEGTWIINGKTEEDSNWTLEISDGKYKLSNEYQEFEGDIIFTPGFKELDKPDTLCLDFDPSLKIEIVLENLAGGLIDVSGQGLVFVRPGNFIEFDLDEEFQNYSKEDMIGDWVLEGLHVFVLQYDFYMCLTNADIMAGSITGDDRLILSFEDGVLYQVSEKTEIRVPITRYRDRGPRGVYFENPKPIVPYVNKFDAYVVPKGKELSAKAGQMVIVPYPIPEDAADAVMYMTFSRITGEEQ
ncbi:MAG: hypothetical protein ACOX75_05465 [Lachnospiraceae bacterium]|jgi:hypothetical protein